MKGIKMTPRDFLLALLIEVEDWMPNDPPMNERHLKNHKDFLVEEHYGDCTNVPMTCVRCCSEEREARTDAALEFLKASGFVLLANVEGNQC